ncbi:UNVERIFIED_CONTAM: hypothetical protein FKN15_048153 [Acipenser sinensis]
MGPFASQAIWDGGLDDLLAGLEDQVYSSGTLVLQCHLQVCPDLEQYESDKQHLQLGLAGGHQRSNATLALQLCRSWLQRWGRHGMSTENTDSQRLNTNITEIQALQEVVGRFRQLRLDATEFACLKCIVTFKAVPTHSGSDLRTFRNASAIASLQDEAQLTLNSYIHTSRPCTFFAVSASLVLEG